jgi:SNF2 family DNA or RNA helicase
VRQPLPDWYIVPPDVRPPKLPGAGHGEVHRSHLPLIPAVDRERILTANGGYGVHGPQYAWPDAAQLRPYQVEAAQFSRVRAGSILALDMGTGKSRTSLCGTYLQGGIGVIVAPLVTWNVWKKEIALIYGPNHPVFALRGRTCPSGLSALTKPGTYLINPEILLNRTSDWYNNRPDWVILDESHYFVNRKANRSRGAQDLAAKAGHRIALTGTPILRHVADLYGILKAACPGAFGSWYDFAREVGATHGAHGLVLGKPTPEMLDRLDARLSEVMIRKRWEDVASFVPKLTRERVPITLSAADTAEYNRLLKDVRHVFGNRVCYADLLKASHMMQVGALHRFVGRAKVASVVDLACATGEPVVIWTWHRDVADAVAKGIHARDGSVADVVTGEDTQAKRDRLIAQFQTGKSRVLVCTMSAAGVGIDLTVARISIYAEIDWTPAVMAQCERRTWRSGQTRPCISYWPVVEGTVDEHALDVLLSKEEYAKSGLLEGIAVTTPASVESTIVDLVDLVVGEGN